MSRVKRKIQRYSRLRISILQIQYVTKTYIFFSSQRTFLFLQVGGETPHPRRGRRLGPYGGAWPRTSARGAPALPIFGSANIGCAAECGCATPPEELERASCQKGRPGREDVPCGRTRKKGCALGGAEAGPGAARSSATSPPRRSQLEMVKETLLPSVLPATEIPERVRTAGPIPQAKMA